MAAETKTKAYRQRFGELKSEVTSEGWLEHWRDLADFFAPNKGRYLSSDRQDQNKDGEKKYQKIINGSAYDARRILAAGMQGGLTSSSRPWFRLSTSDPDLCKFAPVKWWLHTVRDLILDVFRRSNFYGSTHGLYSDLSTFATASMIIDEDLTQVIRCRPMTIGEYYLGLNSKYRVDTLYRQFSYTTYQMVGEFGIENVSEAVRSAYKNDQLGTRFEVRHVLQPNKNLKSDNAGVDGKAYESVYYEASGDTDNILRRKGYRQRPFVAPRWDVVGISTYGCDSPGMISLGDQRMLQKEEAKKLKALDKSIDPPMNAPSSMKNKGGTVIPGGVNYIDIQAGQQSFTPAYQINPNLQAMAYEIEAVCKRIRSFHFNDMFLAVLNEEKKMTATEVAKRYEEKMMMLGPILERLQDEFLDDIIDRTYQIMWDLDMLPPLPKELQGQQIKIEYISLLAQAQRMVEISGMENTFAFAGSIAQMKPEILDRLDVDEAIDVYSEANGAPPKIIKSIEQATAIRQQRAQQMAMAQAAAMAQPVAQAAGAAKDLSGAQVGDQNVLERLMGTMGGQ